MLLFQISKRGVGKKNLMAEWGMRTYGQSITWLPNSTTKAATCLLIPRGKTLLCLPGLVLQMSARYDADASFHADIHQGIQPPQQSQEKWHKFFISSKRLPHFCLLSVHTRMPSVSSTAETVLTKHCLLNVYSLIQLNFVSWLFSLGTLGIFSLNI